MAERGLTATEAAKRLHVRPPDVHSMHQSGRVVPILVSPPHQTGRYGEEQLGELEAALESHRSPQFTFIDLFAGIGGLRRGFDDAGGTCVFSSEIDRFARQTYEANYGDQPHGDINAIPLGDIPYHDLVLGGFPCQPFSLAGVSKYESLGRPHGFDDADKGSLFFRVAEIIEYHQPLAFVLENVKHLTRHDGGETFKRVHRILGKELDYEVDWRVLDARWVVPQHRERVFIVGLRRDLFEMARGSVKIEWPPQAGEQKQLKDILLPDEDVDPKYTISTHLWEYFKEYAKRQRLKGNGFGYGLPDRDGITRTLSARYYKDGAEILINQAHLDKPPRRLTPRECARLMGFPDTFEIPVSDTQAYRQFGNSVVVPLAAQLAQSVAEAIVRLKEVERDITRQMEFAIPA